tara:strand:- start:454 stop:684 length:231 start_codon:yes stop_codon:yes gene_type:complete
MTNTVLKCDALKLVHLHSDMLALTSGHFPPLSRPIETVAQYKRLVKKTGLSVASPAFLKSLDIYADKEVAKRKGVK